MKGRKKTFLAKQEAFETACREAGLKLTHQRLEIFRELQHFHKADPAYAAGVAAALGMSWSGA